jgi:L-fuconate dehydratase
VAGSLDGRWIEYVDHLHEHFAEPVRVDRGRYSAPRVPGSGAQLREEAIARYRFYADQSAQTPAVSGEAITG